MAMDGAKVYLIDMSLSMLPSRPALRLLILWGLAILNTCKFCLFNIKKIQYSFDGTCQGSNYNIIENNKQAKM